MENENKNTISFIGKPSGDGECFCWEVTEKEYRRIMGEEEYQAEVEFYKEDSDLYHISEKLWFIYPNNVIQNSNLPKKYIIIEEDVK
jgi:hypothetical protein